MKLLFFMMSLNFITLNLFATVQYDHVLNTHSGFELNLEYGETKLDHALLLEENLLKNFSPSGVKILKKTVNGREFELYIEKKILGFTKKFTIVGNVQVSKPGSGCAINETSHHIFFDFSQSGPDVTDAVAAFSLDLCSKLNSPNGLSVSTRNALYYRGKKYGMITEPIAKSVLNDQVVAFFNSVKITIKELK